MSYNLKPALTIAEQIDRLRQRDMIITDESEAADVLARTNYYRFTGYAFLFQKANNHYVKGTSFQQILRLMDFDTALRQILMSSLEYIEIYARTQIAYWFSLNHEKDGGAHYDPTLFVEEKFHLDYISNLEKQIDNNSSQPFVAHHIQSFGGKMPLWCAVEILSFSMLSKLYSNMKSSDKELIAANMDTDVDHLTNWLHCFSVLRNTCAHYNRLYSIVFCPRISLDGKLMRKHAEIQQDTLFAYVIAMLRIMPDMVQKKRLTTSLESLIEEYKGDIQLGSIGFPDDWKELLTDEQIITLRTVSQSKKQLNHFTE